jgi:hypothetical protein
MVLDHWSLFSFRFPQCVSLRSGLNSRTTCRFAQGRLDLYVDKQTEIQGIEMGVLSDGLRFSRNAVWRGFVEFKMPT